MGLRYSGRFYRPGRVLLGSSSAGVSGLSSFTIEGYRVHVSVEGYSATVLEGHVSFGVQFISAIVNDGADDITFNFDAATTAAGAFTLKPGESYGGIPMVCDHLYYKAASGSQPFRAWGAR
jgi:hypothetical protein